MFYETEPWYVIELLCERLTFPIIYVKSGLTSPSPVLGKYLYMLYTSSSL